MDVAVLAGGPSVEHEVSLQTGANMLALLREGGHRAAPVFIDRANRWRFGDATASLEVLAGESAPGLPLDEALRRLAAGGVIACLGLHGAFGEDGQLQRRLEDLGVPFTGAGSEASAIGMDKELSKLAATRVGARTAAHERVGPGKVPRARLLSTVGLPCFVKPVRGGSSVGVSRVARAEELEAAVRGAQAQDARGEALVEAAVEGLELACAVLRDGGALRCLPPVAILPAGGAFYDYHAKYEADDTRLVCPADVTAATRAEVERVAAALHAGLQLRGVARVDFIVRASDAAPVFIEVNTLPGFTGHSLVPLAARAAGLSPRHVLECALAEALAAAPVRAGRGAR